MSKTKVSISVVTTTTKVISMSEDQVKEACIYWLKRELAFEADEKADVKFDIRYDMLESATITTTCREEDKGEIT